MNLSATGEQKTEIYDTVLMAIGREPCTKGKDYKSL